MDDKSFSLNTRLQEKLAVTYQSRDTITEKCDFYEAIIVSSLKVTLVNPVFFPRNLKSDFVLCLYHSLLYITGEQIDARRAGLFNYIMAEIVAIIMW
jgi:hypothetical protein